MSTFSTSRSGSAPLSQLVLAVSLAPLLALMGCAADAAAKQASQPLLTPAAFRAAATAASTPTAAEEVNTPQASQPPLRELPRETDAAETIVLTGPPALASPAAEAVSAPAAPAAAAASSTGRSSASTGQASSSPQVSGAPAGRSVDALVGQINGRPLFASEFFAPMDARLRAEARRLPPRQWAQFAREEINRALRTRVVNELLLAEARASLTPEQRKGLLAFIENFRETLVSQNQGSEEIAERNLLEQEGATLDQKARELLDQELLRMQLRKALADQVQVSWREVEIEYERRKDEFQPPPTITLRMIRIPADDLERRRRVEEALAKGEPFEAVARRQSAWNPEGGGLYPRDGALQLDAPSLAEANIFGPAPLNDAARSLSPGAWTGPIEFNGSLHWLYLERVERRSVSLFDAQLQLYNELRNRRLQEAEQRYLEELISRGSLTNLARMEQRLLAFAIERYLLSPEASAQGAGSEGGAAPREGDGAGPPPTRP